MNKWLDLALASMGEQEACSSDFPYAVSADSADRSEPKKLPIENNSLAPDLSARAVLQLGAVRSENAGFAADLTPSARFAGVSDEWLSGFDRLISIPIPLGLGVTRWLQVWADTERFLEQWGVRAAALGWDTLALFGVCPDGPEHRTDLMGLIWLLRGKPVAAMTEHLAMIDMGKSTRQSFPRRTRPGQVPIWTLPTTQEAPRHG